MDLRGILLRYIMVYWFVLVNSMPETCLLHVQTTDTELVCSTCGQEIGHIDRPSAGFRLRKMFVSVADAAYAPIVHPEEKWLACQLLSCMDAQGVRKFTVRSGSDSSQSALDCWIFTPDLIVSTSKANAGKPFRAIKVLWEESTRQADEGKLMNREALSQGDVEMQSGELQTLRRCLERSANLLPATARNFQQWSVALLSRFDLADVQLPANDTDVERGINRGQLQGQHEHQ